jgi:hypothetical protein
MSLLSFLAAVLLVMSGALKIRSGRRFGVGFSPLAVVEIIAGVALAVLSARGALGAEGLPRWSVPAGVVLVLVSTTVHALKLRAERLQLAESEGGRLVAYVKYLSAGKDPH